MEDQDLVKQVLNGNMRAYGILIDQHQLLVAHMVSRVISNDQDREELCQDIFVKVYESLGEFKGNSKLSTWIATISYRTAINFAKKQSRRNEVLELDDIAFKVGSIDDRFQSEDFNRFIRSIIDQMPASYRIVLTLFYLEGFTYPEIIEITNMPEGTVKNYLFRAKQKLKDLLLPYLGNEIEI